MAQAIMTISNVEKLKVSQIEEDNFADQVLHHRALTVVLHDGTELIFCFTGRDLSIQEEG